MLIQDLFFEYPWNNFLHTQVEQSIKSIFASLKSTSPVTSPVPSDNSTPTAASLETASLLAGELLEGAQLVKRLVEAVKDSEDRVTSNQHRLGYMGHIFEISNHVVDFSQEPALKQRLDDMDPEIGETWKLFVSNTLAESNKRIQTPLVNETPPNMFAEDLSFQENALQQVRLHFCLSV